MLKNVFLVLVVMAGVTPVFAASSITCSPNPIGFRSTATCTLTYPSFPTFPPVTVGFSVNGQKWGGVPAQPGGGTFTTGVPANILNIPGTYTVSGQAWFSNTTTTLANTTLTVRGVTGFVNPKYVIVGVTYAPPGPSSNVTYTSSTFVGNTTTTTDSYQNEASFSVSVTGGIGAWMPNATGFGVKITGTESTDYTQGSNSSQTVTISKQTTISDKTNGTGNAFTPVNHDYDTIWLWLNPLMIYTVDPNNPPDLQWNGYGYDNKDVLGLDVFGVQVGWLNGHFGVNPSIKAVLARSWVTANEPGMIWPAGEGPGLTSTDIANILQADPFTSGSYSLPSPLPSTSADQRYTQEPYPPNPVNYVQSGPGNGGGTTVMYNAVYTNTSIVGKGTSHTFKQAFGTEEEFKGGTFLGSLTVDLHQTDTLTWTHTWMNTLTTTKTLTDALSVTGPGCPQTSPPCVPVYRGPGEFVVFQDNLYGSFMFYPSN